MSNIKSYLKHLDEHIIGWYGLLLPILLEIEKYNKENKGNEVKINVKEKFGGLRINLSGEGTYLDKMAERVEAESYKICQLCGSGGETTWIDNWRWTLCDYHAEALKENGNNDEKIRLQFIKNFKK